MKWIKCDKDNLPPIDEWVLVYDGDKECPYYICRYKGLWGETWKFTSCYDNKTSKFQTEYYTWEDLDNNIRKVYPRNFDFPIAWSYIDEFKGELNGKN